MKLKWTKEDLPIYSQVIFNCILSCNTIEQLEVAEEMIYHFIVDRFKDSYELNSIHNHLQEAIKRQRRHIDCYELPTISRYLN